MIKFEYDNNGKLYVMENGKRIGEIRTVGDEIIEETQNEEIRKIQAETKQ